MKPMTPEEEAAHRLGDSAHMRAFIEDAAVRIHLGLIAANYHNETKGRLGGEPPPAGCAAALAGELWDAVEKQVKARGG